MKLDLREWETESRPEAVPELAIPQEDRTSYPCFSGGGGVSTQNRSI